MSSEIYIALNNLELHFGENVLLDNTSLSIHKGDKIGLVGRNGSGKSSFLKVLIENISIDGGNIDKKRDLKIGYLSQEFNLNPNETIYENIISEIKGLKEFFAEYNELDEENSKKHELFEKISHLNGWNINGKIDNYISKLHIPDKSKLVRDLSGGEKRRVSLCKAIISDPELLILDEPTNHLDTESIHWLEKYLMKFSGACIFVTHDRYFLDNISNRIVELAGGKFHNHSGNYTDYLVSKAKRQETELAKEKNRQKFLRRELEWVRKGPKGRLAKNEGRVDRYYEEAGKEKAEKELDVEMIIPKAPKLSNRILDIKSLSYEIAGKRLFHNLNIEFKPNMKLGVIGRNGLGKSTLLKIILGKLQPNSGTVDIASRTEINYVDQDKLVPDEENTVYKEIGEGRDVIPFGEKTIQLKLYLKRFLFNHKRMFAQIKNLSGGERSRLLLAKILKNGGNFIILDEPTNDLDLNTLRVLEEALINFEGCAIIVSHDRYFLNRVCTDILAFEGDGKTFLSSGDYDFYLKKRNEKISEDFAASANLEGANQNIQKQRLTRDELQELKRIERQIASSETKLKATELKFADPEFMKKTVEEMKKLNSELEEERKKINGLYMRWEELESRR